MSHHFYNYIGPSMYPTLRVGDGLVVMPYQGRPIKKGDLVVFKSPQDGKQVVHRVIRITERGIQTRGDNNRLPDPYELKPTDILGRVVKVRRGGRTLFKYNGFIGQQVAMFRRGKNRIGRFLYRLFSIPYQKIAPLHLPLIKAEHLRVAVFHKNGNAQQVLMFGHRLIGRRQSTDQPWVIRAPWRYFINEKIFLTFEPKVSQQKKWVKQWHDAGIALKEQKRISLKNMSPEEGLKISNQLLCSSKGSHFLQLRKSNSGLVEQQRWFHRRSK